MNKRSFSFPVLTVVLMIFGILGISTSAPLAQAAEPIVIKIGSISPLSGPAAPWGQTPVGFYDNYIELVNKAGGIKVGGKMYKFKLIQVDDRMSAEGGAAAAKRLIHEEKVKFILGYWSWNFPVVAGITNSAKAILFTRTGHETCPGGSVYNAKKMPYVVFSYPTLEMYINELRGLAEKYPNSKICTADSALGKGPGWDYVHRELTKGGVKFHHEWYAPETKDFTPVITRFKEAGCSMYYGAGDVMAAMMIAKQRWDMGMKDFKVGTGGAMLSPDMYISVIGNDAAQGFMSRSGAIWDAKKTKINPIYVNRVQEAMKMETAKTGKPYIYAGASQNIPTDFEILIQAMQKAGTVEDTAAIMKAIRGGTFDTPSGKITMSGAKTYGSPILGSWICLLSEIQGNKEVTIVEIPWMSVP